jgi:L-glyceraldehyde 3-phosphate reductase
MGTRLLIVQPVYSLLNRGLEGGLLDAIGDEGLGCIVFSPLAQGLLTDKYLHGIPEGSRASRDPGFARDVANDATLNRVRGLNEIATRRGQSLAQMALAWTLCDPRVTSTLIGVSSVAQLEDSLGALQQLDFSPEELAEIDRITAEA